MSAAAIRPTPSFAEIRRNGVRREEFLYFVIVSNGPGVLLAWLASRLNLSPNTVTCLGIALVLPAAGLNIAGEFGWGVVLFHVFFVFDCADGILARATAQKSPVGAYLDDLAHEVFHPIFMISVAWGFHRADQTELGFTCILAAAANTLLRANMHLVQHWNLLARRDGGGCGRLGTAQRARSAILRTFDFPNILTVITVALLWPLILGPYLWYCIVASAGYVLYMAVSVLRWRRTA